MRPLTPIAPQNGATEAEILAFAMDIYRQDPRRWTPADPVYDEWDDKWARVNLEDALFMASWAGLQPGVPGTDPNENDDSGGPKTLRRLRQGRRPPENPHRGQETGRTRSKRGGKTFPASEAPQQGPEFAPGRRGSMSFLQTAFMRARADERQNREVEDALKRPLSQTGKVKG